MPAISPASAANMATHAVGIPLVNLVWVWDTALTGSYGVQ